MHQLALVQFIAGNIPSELWQPVFGMCLWTMVQPATSQMTEYVPSYAGAGHTPVIAVGAPALTKSVKFYEGSTLLGSGGLTANGTAASLTIYGITAGTHTYTAQYPGDSYYGALAFGSVTVTAN